VYDNVTVKRGFFNGLIGCEPFGLEMKEWLIISVASVYIFGGAALLVLMNMYGSTAASITVLGAVMMLVGAMAWWYLDAGPHSIAQERKAFQEAENILTQRAKEFLRERSDRGRDGRAARGSKTMTDVT